VLLQLGSVVGHPIKQILAGSKEKTVAGKLNLACPDEFAERMKNFFQRGTIHGHGWIGVEFRPRGRANHNTRAKDFRSGFFKLG